MSEISASERRLGAALDKIDRLLEARSMRPVAEDGDLRAELDRERALNAELQAQLQTASAPEDHDHEGELADLRSRLDTAAENAARLSAANEELTTANRNLIDAHATGGIGDDEMREALEAEVSALRAARAAEMAQMSEIMAELERLLGEDAAPATDPQEVVADGAGLPEDTTDRQEG
ncbi:hypothetical protein Q4511_06740 [Paracoccus sp. 1_MG-2023]|uniref:hypothetical protein n=1 Tax=unclassified Paracoccus (in: a-proteobacteria) TaxID=2688777 RepID=UPI001C07F8B4|nr:MULTISPECIES: hypothetical protein [unclassified Paracoccus (in: a-proteobacteria)]MBU2958401.1 hypothetical protein [Paracoccus sp. C2R09]MDO6668614.1 hypothetical protein [Paracoccus sp. 1_MG-2023]